MDKAPRELRYEATSGFSRFLAAAGCTLAVSVYMSDRVILLSAEGDKLSVRSTPFLRPMGLAVRNGKADVRLAIATFQEVVVFGDVPLLAPGLPGSVGEFQHLLVPRATLFSGDIDAHDLVWIGDRLFAANTRFSCIAEIDARSSFTPVWKPPFVTDLMPEDACHLNGIAAADGRITYVTVLGRTDSPREWKEDVRAGGALLAVPSGEPVLEALSLPHSPRVFSGELYVLESGAGRVLRVDAANRKAYPVAELSGFVRGLDCLGDVLFVGSSKFANATARGCRFKKNIPSFSAALRQSIGVTATCSAGSVLSTRWRRFSM